MRGSFGRVMAVGLVLAAFSCGSDRADTAASPRPTEKRRVEVSSESLAKATLSIDDMETGWSEFDTSELKDEDAVRIGGKIGVGNVPYMHSMARSAFTQGQQQALVPTGYLSNTVMLMALEDTAERVLSDLKEASATRTWEQSRSDGTAKYKLAALAFDRLGDETFTVRLDVTFRDAEFGQEYKFTADYIVYRLGPVVVFLYVVLADSAVLARKSESKVRRLVAGEFE